MQIDPTVIVPFNQRDKGAYKIIFERYYAPLCDYCRRFLGDDNDARDIISELFCKIWQSKRVFSSVSELEGYLFTAARNGSYNHSRRQNNGRMMLEAMVHVSPKEENEFFRKYAETNRVDQLRQQIDLLPEDLAKVLRMKYFENMNHQEIAKRLDVSLKTVHNKLEKGKEILRIRLTRQQNFALLLFFNLLSFLS